MDASDLILSPQLSEDEVHSILTSYGFRDPSRADHHLQQITRITGVPERLARFAPILLNTVASAVSPDAAMRHLESFFEVVPSPLNLLSLMEEDSRVKDLLVGILGASPYLTQALIRNPEYFYWLIEGNRLECACDKAYFEDKLDEMVRPFDSLVPALNAVRRFRRRESLRIGAQDVLGCTQYRDTVHQLSFLAEAVLQKTFELLAAERLPDTPNFVVFALGKLGGWELNFSSDIDLLFLYLEEDSREAMLKFAKEYTKCLSEFTSEGHLYRVDLRLRPMGRGGEIAYSKKAASNYYQTWADTTDRLALIKCRPVAGDLELGKQILEDLQDFIFKKYLDYAAVEEIRWIKKRTDEQIAREEVLPNVKLGLGGIREIEFFVQAFQILYAGLQKELRTPTTLKGLERLLDGGFIQMSEYRALTEAYIFLRNLEHKLQLVHDLQTHSLPDESLELAACARRMGYGRNGDRTDEAVLKEFQRDLKNHNVAVREIFSSLFEEPSAGRDLEELVLNPSLTEEEALQKLRNQKADNPETLLEGIRLLQQAPSFPHSPSRLRNLLANLVPTLVTYARNQPQARELFNRFDRFCEALGSRAHVYSEVIENKLFAERLLAVFSSGDFLSETLIRNPELLEAVAEPIEPAPVRNKLRVYIERQKRKGMAPQDALRIFKRREEFKIGIGELLSPGGIASRQHLTRLAEACLEVSCQETALVYPNLSKEPYCLIGLGKLGGEELIFHSDLDLLFVVDDSATDKGPHEFLPLLKHVREQLQQYRETGRAYSIDFRLRPEGRHSTEVVLASQLVQYFEKGRVEPWERLAYIKGRPVFEQGFSISTGPFSFQSPFTEQEIQDLNRIRWRKEDELGRESSQESFNLKVGRGSLLDIQFVVQFLQIQYQIESPNTLSAISKLEVGGHLSSGQAGTLKEAISFYFAIESGLDLLGKESNHFPRQEESNKQLAQLLGHNSGSEFVDHYQETRESVRRIYEEFFGPLSSKT